MKKIITFLCFSAALTCSAQYQVGDQLPDLVLGSNINQPSRPVRLSQFKTPALVLDMMSLYCSSCIAALPVYDSLQATFSPSAQILILVNAPKKKALDFYKKMNWQRFTHLSFIIMDTMLAQQFNITSVPFYVWLSKERNIQAITGSQYVKPINIRKLVNAEDLSSWPDISLPPAEPLISAERIENTGTKKTFFSILTGYQVGKRKRQELLIDTARNAQFWQIENLPVLAVYDIAVRNMVGEQLRGTRFQVQVRDTTRFVFDASRSYRARWERDNSISYEAVLPLGLTEKERAQKLLSDLNLFLGLNGKLEVREMNAWVINRLPLANNGKSPASPAAKEEGYRFATIQQLLYSLTGNPRYETVISDLEQDFPAPLYISKEQLNDSTLLQQRLNTYGYTLTRQSRSLQVFILSDD